MHPPRPEPTASSAPRPRPPAGPADEHAGPLSATEVDVLRMLRDGRPAVAAAHATGITLAAIARATTKLRSRYDTPSTAGALSRAQEDGLL